MSEKNRPIKQHWVPQSYLRGFRDAVSTVEKPFVWFFEKDRAFQKPKLVPAKSIFFKKHLYTIETPDGEKFFEVEEAYAKGIDAKYPPIIAKVEKREPLTDEEHKQLCLFIAAQMMRTPQIQESLINFTDRLADLGEQMAKAHGKESKVAQQIRQDAKNMHILNTIKLIPEIAEVLYQMNIAFACVPDTGKRLITSDRPVFMRNPDLQWQRFDSPGLMQKRIEIYFPASPTTLIILGWQNYRGYVKLTSRWVHEMNRWIQGHATDWFVGSTSNTNLYWFSKLPADPFFLLKIAKFRASLLWDRMKRKYAKR